MLRTIVRRFALLVVLALPAHLAASPYSSVYVLGDSLSDTGNLFLATAGLVGPANAVPGADNYFNGRFTNGPVHTDVLADRLGLPVLPSLIGGTNFAYGGARTDYNAADTIGGGPFPPGLFPWSLNLQIDAFRARGVNDAGALYIVFSGSNDIADILTRGLNPGVVIPGLLDGVLRAVQAFQEAGAQTIVVPNVPDLGLTPAFVGNPIASAAATALTAQYNALLAAGLAAVAGPQIIPFDTFGFLRAIVADPVAFGYTDVSSACYSGFVLPEPDATVCANPDEFLFWDVVHPTARTHALLGHAILGALPATAVGEPATAALLLFIGLFALLRRGNAQH